MKQIMNVRGAVGRAGSTWGYLASLIRLTRAYTKKGGWYWTICIFVMSMNTISPDIKNSDLS